MVTPMLDAQNDSTPLVVFSGQVSLESKGKLAFQECEATSITKSCTKWSYDVKKNDDLFELTNEAIRVANHGKKGCVHIDIPKCILNDLNGNNIVKFNSYEKNIKYIQHQQFILWELLMKQMSYHLVFVECTVIQLQILRFKILI